VRATGEIHVCPQDVSLEETGIKEALAALAAALLSAALVAAAQDASGPSIWGGVFTAARPQRGNRRVSEPVVPAATEAIFTRPTQKAVDLTGPAIRAKWNGKTPGGIASRRYGTPCRRRTRILSATKRTWTSGVHIFSPNEFQQGVRELIPPNGEGDRVRAELETRDRVITIKEKA
jgi:hypothetical protein